MHISELDVTDLERGRKGSCWLDITPRGGRGLVAASPVDCDGKGAGTDAVSHSRRAWRRIRGCRSDSRYRGPGQSVAATGHTAHGSGLQYGRLRHRHPQQPGGWPESGAGLSRPGIRQSDPAYRPLAYTEVDRGGRLFHRSAQRRHRRRHPHAGRLYPQRG